MSVSTFLGSIKWLMLQLSIHKIYPFTAEGVAESQKDIASRSTTGKLLIKVAE